MTTVPWWNYLSSVIRKCFQRILHVRIVCILIKTKAELDMNTWLLLVLVSFNQKRKSVKRNMWIESERTVHQRKSLCRWCLGKWAFGSRKGLSVNQQLFFHVSRRLQKMLECSLKGACTHTFYKGAWTSPLYNSWACTWGHCTCASRCTATEHAQFSASLRSLFSET